MPTRIDQPSIEPTAYDEAQAGALCDDAKAGNADARAALIALFNPFLRTVVISFVARNSRYRHLAEELESFCNLELVNTIDRVLRRAAKPASIKATVIRSLTAGMMDEAGLLQSIVTQSASTLKRRRKRKEHIEKARLLDPTSEARAYTRKERANRRKRLLREVIDSCCNDVTDERIIALREQGYTDKEIAAQLGVHLDTVNGRRNLVRLRYEREMTEVPPLKALGA